MDNPAVFWVRLNVDGASKSNPKTAGDGDGDGDGDGMGILSKPFLLDLAFVLRLKSSL